VAVKVAAVEPAETVTDAGTLSTVGALLESITTSPPAPAAFERDTVQLDVPPGMTLAGAQDNELINSGARRERDAVCELPL
jgi:hypothetical protein